LVAVAAGAAGKLAGVGIGIFGLELARDRDMVAQGAVVVADRLAFGGDPGEVPRPRQGPADRRAEPVLHLRLRKNGGVAPSLAGPSRFGSPGMRRAAAYQTLSRTAGEGGRRASGDR